MVFRSVSDFSGKLRLVANVFDEYEILTANRDAIVDVELHCGSDFEHLQQIYTGFSVLANQKRIRLRSTIRGRGLMAIVNGKNLVYDVADGKGIDESQLKIADFYFKRSYHPDHVARVDPLGRVVPLGLNYEVYPDRVDWAGFKRGILLGASTRQKAQRALRALMLGRTFTPRLGAMQASDTGHVSVANVLFLTRVWDPIDTLPHGKAARDEINDMRAGCILAVRREFGDRALAGFAPTPLAKSRYASLLAPDVTEKSKYIAMLRKYSVCIATTGLHGSIGWKFGEYVAFAKAIVSERLNYRVPDLRAGEHYLEFNTPDQCVSTVSRLFDDIGLRRSIADNNLKYYMTHLRPDCLVMRSLSYALAPVANFAPTDVATSADTAR